MARIAGLILAAGAGERFGFPKILARVGDRYVVDHVADALIGGGCQPPLLVVAGPRWTEAAVVLRVSIDAGRIRLLHNPDWVKGMGASLRLGLRALDRRRCAAAVIALGDQWGVSPVAVGRAIRAWRAGAQIAVPKYGDVRGYPVLLARRWWLAAQAAEATDDPVRHFIRTHPELVTEIWCDDLPSPLDVDTPADLERFRDRLDTGGLGC